MLIDQHIQTADAVYVDFFNRPAATTSALAALALRTGAPVVPVFALPLPGGRFRMVYEHAVEPPPGDDPDAIRDFTQRCTDVLEMYVRRYPDLWLWMHRRWRDVDNGSGRGHVPGRERRKRGSERARRSASVVRAPNWLGDAVMALPAMAALRARVRRADADPGRRPLDCAAVPRGHPRPRPIRCSSVEKAHGGGHAARRSDAGARRAAAQLVPHGVGRRQAGIRERWGYRAQRPRARC